MGTWRCSCSPSCRRCSPNHAEQPALPAGAPRNRPSGRRRGGVGAGRRRRAPSRRLVCRRPPPRLGGVEPWPAPRRSKNTTRSSRTCGARSFTVTLVHDWRGQGLSAAPDRGSDPLRGPRRGFLARLSGRLPPDARRLRGATCRRPWISACGHSMGGGLTAAGPGPRRGAPRRRRPDRARCSASRPGSRAGWRESPRPGRPMLRLGRVGLAYVRPDPATPRPGKFRAQRPDP